MEACVKKFCTVGVYKLMLLVWIKWLMWLAFEGLNKIEGLLRQCNRIDLDYDLIAPIR